MARINKPGKYFIILFLCYLLFPVTAVAWSEHSLMTHTALKNHPLFANPATVEAKSLKNFLMELEDKLPEFFRTQEQWSIENLPNYKPCPAESAFKSSGNPGDILVRFFSAIRINPGAKIPLYIQLLPGESISGRQITNRSDVTTLSDTSSMIHSIYLMLGEGDKMNPLDVLCTASEEPDFGFDLGLFDDNQTTYGLKYGFGTQPFGNPNLEYSSQAPFHMGFFHEAKILYKFGPFLKSTYLDYRIFLYKALAEFAFENNQPYWGWRFLGWGMHYVGDVTMPYHTKPLPGVSTFRMLWINLQSMLGMEAPKSNALQIVSNRHTVLEEFQGQVVRESLEGKGENLLLSALQKPDQPVPFTHENLIDIYAGNSARSAKTIDKALIKNMPEHLVSDPKIEANSQPETKQILEFMKQKGGEKSVEMMASSITGRMSAYSMCIRSFLDSVLGATSVK